VPPPERLAVHRQHPLVRHDVCQPAAGPQHAETQLVEVHVEVRAAVVRRIVRLQVGFDAGEQLGPDIGRVPDHPRRPAPSRAGLVPVPRVNSGSTIPR
jgi:hypothetical protein